MKWKQNNLEDFYEGETNSSSTSGGFTFNSPCTCRRCLEAEQVEITKKTIFDINLFIFSIKLIKLKNGTYDLSYGIGKP